MFCTSSGTIYDPEYNLYQRKENCRVQDNNEMPPKVEGKLLLLLFFFLLLFFKWVAASLDDNILK